MRLRSSRPYLPPELIDRIIDHLHDRPSDLRNCARAAKIFLASSRFHIFYHISIYPRSKRRSVVPFCRKLNRLIQRSPQIALCIREFHFSVHYDGRFQMPQSELPTLREDLPTLLNSLTALRKLEISGIRWTRVPPEVRKAFRTVLALPSLVSLESTCLSFSTLQHFTNLLNSPLKRLSVDISWGDYADDDETISVIDEEDKIAREPDRQPCRLEYLASSMAYFSPGFVDWLLGPQSIIDISNIRTLDAWCNPKEAEIGMVRLMKSLGPSLEHVTIQFPQIEAWGTSFISFLPCHVLKVSLNIQTNHLLILLILGTTQISKR